MRAERPRDLAEEHGATSRTFDDFFHRLTNHRRHDWQARLTLDAVAGNRLIRIPTGFGKTAGVTNAWLRNRVHQGDHDWPRRIVLCLPMRTLVEQTELAVKEWLARAGLTHEVASIFSWAVYPPQIGTLNQNVTQF